MMLFSLTNGLSGSLTLPRPPNKDRTGVDPT
jgi:hypothetical protein